MDKYKYTALNLAKKKYSGVFLAESEADLRRQLAEQNLFLTSCRVITGKTPSSFFSVSSKVKVSEITTFCRQFAIMINAGISILSSLDTLRKQSYSTLFRKVLEMVYEDVKSGTLLSEACKKHKKVFPEFFVSMTYVGEMSGSLDMILNSLAEYYERDNRIRRKAKSAMVYPLVLGFLTLAILVLMFVMIIPMFKEVLTDMNVEMPPITLVIINISDTFTSKWRQIFLCVMAVVLAFIMFKRTKFGTMTIDRLKTKLPVISKITSATVASRFSRGFGVLLASGMDVIDALDLMGDLLGNKYVESKFKLAVEEIRRGEKISTAILKHKIFPDILTQMIAVGESTGALDSVLVRTSGYFDDQLESALTGMTSLLEPAMIIIMGLIVGTIILAIYTPMLSMMTTIG